MKVASRINEVKAERLGDRFFRYREGNDKGSALAGLAVDRNAATVGLRHVLDNGEAQAAAIRVGSASALPAVEAVKNMGQVFLWDADTGILDLHSGNAILKAVQGE